jgi:hypothetical protein
MGVRVHKPAHRRIIPERRKQAIKASFVATILAAATFTLAQTNAGAAAAYNTVQPGTFKGYAFDACTAPSTTTMNAWKASPYKAIGIYIGGVSRGCTQANLTPAWVQTTVTSGWKLLPLYVGPQASCLSSSMSHVIDNADAVRQGRSTAVDAVAKASALGLAKGSVIIYDMEAYNTADAACRKGVLDFMNGWTTALHDVGYSSGFYSSAGSGLVDQSSNYWAPGYAPPDYIDFARWDNQVVTTDPSIASSAMWNPNRRMKQYAGGHNETFGGVTINIDSNYVDYAPLPPARFADFDNNGWPDLVARNTSNGVLYNYPGAGGSNLSQGTRRAMGSGWNGMNAIVRIGDLNRDGKEDVIARENSSGDMYFYPGTTTGFGTRTKIASKWTSIREITAIGDFNRDGYPDLAALEGDSIYLYPGTSGNKLAARKLLGYSGWSARSELAGVGDFDRNGYVDFVAKDNSTGTLWLYPGLAGSKVGARVSLGTGWNDFRDVVGVGDFNRDIFLDIMAVRKSDNRVMLFRGDSKKLLPSIATNVTFPGWGPLL